MRVWFSGRTRPCQGRDAVSITATRTKVGAILWSGRNLPQLFPRRRSEKSCPQLATQSIDWVPRSVFRFLT